MKKAKISQNFPVTVCYHFKFNKFFYQVSLLAIAVGIFLLPKTAFMASITPDRIMELTNQERARAGLNELTENDKLTQAAANKAQAILANQIFDHTINNRKFSTWIKETGYEYSIVGENLAIDFVTSEGVLKAWLASPSHRENIFNNEYREIGIAVIEGKFEGQKTIVIAQIFGTPLAQKPDIPPEISRLHEHLFMQQVGYYQPATKYLAYYYNIINYFNINHLKQVALF
jgi:hypothetical protein